MQLQRADHAAASIGMGPSMRDYDQMEHGTSYDHFGNGFGGANRCISVAPDMQHHGGITQHSGGNTQHYGGGGIQMNLAPLQSTHESASITHASQFGPRPATPRLNQQSGARLRG